MRRGFRVGAPMPAVGRTASTLTGRPSPLLGLVLPLAPEVAEAHAGASRAGDGEPSSLFGSCIARSVRDFVRLFTSALLCPAHQSYRPASRLPVRAPKR